MSALQARKLLPAGATLLCPAPQAQAARAARALAAPARRRGRAKAAAPTSQAAPRLCGRATPERASTPSSPAKSRQEASEAPMASGSARRRDWSSMTELDALLVEYFDQMFRRGVNGNTGPRLLAALSHVMPIP